MATADILGAASAAFPIWDGRSTIKPTVRSATNQTGPSPSTLMRIINSYDGGTLANTELAQALVIGPKPELAAASTTYTCLTSQIVRCLTTGLITVVMPTNPYDGMVVVVKDITGTGSGQGASTYNVTVTPSAGQLVEGAGSVSGGNWYSSVVFNVDGFCVTYVWNAYKSHWDCHGYVA